jgi:hypothetical protein
MPPLTTKNETEASARALREAWATSPHPSYKHTNYFRIYAELFGHLVGTPCTFIETGVLEGGSLFMWRKWLGDRARIIGVDLNPQAAKWRDHGFDIHIGDQGDPEFWRSFHRDVGPFDALLDDGGHQSFQQIVTVQEALRAAVFPCVIAVEDTHTNFATDFGRHGRRSFLEYAKDSTDVLLAKSSHFETYGFPTITNPEIVNLFANVHSVTFLRDIVAFTVDPETEQTVEMAWNRPPNHSAADFRYRGRNAARVLWPSMFRTQMVTVRGGKTWRHTARDFIARGLRYLKQRVFREGKI